MKTETLKSPEEYGCKIENRLCLFKTSPISQWYGCFTDQSSNFTKGMFPTSPNEEIFFYDDYVFNCAEQWMMACKAAIFGDKLIFNQILKTTHPRKMQELGRQVKNYNQETWDKMKYKVVLEGNLQKFKQNKHLGDFLRQFPVDTIFVESTLDCVWGTGLSIDSPDASDESKWLGQNLLGKVISEVRKEI